MSGIVRCQSSRYARIASGPQWIGRGRVLARNDPLDPRISEARHRLDVASVVGLDPAADLL
jgi:hypothetical protein